MKTTIPTAAGTGLRSSSRALSLLLALFLLLSAVPSVFAEMIAEAADTGVTLDGTDTTVELEDQTLNGGTADTKIPAYTGSGYATGFTAEGSGVSFDVNVTKAGIYGLSLRSALPIENLALGKPQTASHTQTSGSVTDGNPERGSYWGSGQPVSEEEPKWIQIDLGRAMPIHMVRVRVVTDWGPRTETFSVLGSLDNEEFFTLKDTETYSFTSAGKGNLAGNYVDAVFEPTEVRYVRLYFTAISDTGSNGAQVGEFEVYSPVRSAALYLDGDLMSSFTLDTDPENLVGADWEDEIVSWLEKEIGDLLLSPGSHTVAIRYGGSMPGTLNLDSLTFRFKSELNDEEVLDLIDRIGALKPIWQITAADSEEILALVEDYNALDDSKKAFILPTTLEKLVQAARRLTLLGESPALYDLVCYDGQNTGGWSIETGLQVGDISHGDRTFTFNHVPPELWGCDWIRPAMESKRWNEGDTLVSFTVGIDTNLYVAWDSAAPVPAWLEQDGFERTDLTLTINNIDQTVFVLYRRPVSEGEEVSLGTLGMDKATYLVLLEHFTAEEAPTPPEDTTEYPVFDKLHVYDEENASKWSIGEALADGVAAYGDKEVFFSEVPDFLQGSVFLRPAAASGLYAGEALLDVTVNRDGWLYLALPAADAENSPAFLDGFEETAASLRVGEEDYALFRRYADAGSVISLPAQNNESDCYIPIMKSNTVSSSPDRPAISRFLAPFDTDGWYFVRENLDIGSRLFTNTEDTVTALPELYRGCDYIETYRDDKKAVYFYAEREIEVAVTVDTRLSPTPSWLMMWEDTGLTMESGDRSYAIYAKTYAAGSFITVPQLADTPYDNYIVIVRPVDEGKAPTDNPLVEKGEDNTTEPSYSYYVNDVFNQLIDALPEGYRLEGGSLTVSSDDEDKLLDFAYRRPYTCSSSTNEQFGDATDGHVDTYWEAAADDANSFLAVSFGQVRTIDTLVVKVRPHWGARVQTFSVEGSLDGTTYTELLPAADYEFHPDRENTVTITLAEPAEAAYIRLSFSGNTGAPGAQVSELQVYGEKTEGVNRYLTLQPNGSSAWLEREIPGNPDDQIVLEFQLRSSMPDREMRAVLADTEGGEILTLLFDRDGHLRSSDGDGWQDLGAYMPDTWYSFKLIVDLKNGGYEIWLDHLRAAENLKTGTTGAAAALSFGVLEELGSLSIDTLRIYDNSERYLFTEEFDEGDNIPDGWTFSGTDQGAIADVPFASDKSLSFTADGSAAKAIRELPAVAGLFTFKVKIRVTGIGFAAMPMLTDSENRVAAGVAFYHNSLFAVNGDNWVKVMDGASPYAYYPADNWYEIRLVVNTDTRRYDLYVDGALRMTDLSFAEEVSEVSRVSFTLGTDNTAYIDSLAIYEGSSLSGGLIDWDNVIDVKDEAYGAKGDGVTDDTEAIQHALDDAAFTGKTVLLADGVFLASTLQVRSDTTLFIAPTARILGVMAKNHYPLIESCEGLINYRQIGRGLILTENATNVRIEGGGTIDGNGFYGYRVNDPATNRRLQDARPCVILSILSENVTIQNVNLVNSAFWTLVPMESRNVTIRNVNVNSMNTPNRDGIDPCDVINLTIENCNILAGDDGLCFKSSSLFGCANIEVRNLTIQSRSNGIKFGSDTYGSLKNLSVSDITMKNVVKAGITMQSADGAEIENLLFERVTMCEVDDPIFFSVGNRGRQPVDNPGMRIGYIRDVVFRDISFVNAMMPPHSYDADVHEVLLIGLDEEHKIENVLFENVYLEMPGGYTTIPDFPNGVGSGYPEHYSAGGRSNAWAYCIKYADNIQFVNCQNVLIEEDARPEIAYYEGYSDEPALYDSPVRYVLPTRVVAEPGTPESELSLPDAVEAVVGLGKIALLPVVWEADESYDPLTPGVYRFTGTLSNPEGVCGAEDFTASATVTVSGDYTIITSVETPDPITVPFGTAAGALPLPETVTVALSDGTKKDVGVTWNTDSYRSDVPGSYTLTGTLSVSAGENPGALTAALSVTVEKAPDPTITAVETPDPITVAAGTAAGALSLPKTVTVTLSDGTKKDVAVTWNTDSYRTEAGTYTLTGTLSASAEENPDGLTVTLSVTVKEAEVTTPDTTAPSTPDTSTPSTPDTTAPETEAPSTEPGTPGTQPETPGTTAPDDKDSSGKTSVGKVLLWVLIPLVVVAAAVVGGVFFYRKRKKMK